MGSESPLPESARNSSPQTEDPDLGEESYLTQLTAFLEQEFKVPALDVYVEAKFKKGGLLAVLEQAGVLPVAENPNPYGVEQEEEKFEQWANEHPEEQEAFNRRMDERAIALKYLHIGALLGHMVGKHLYPGRKLPAQD